MAASTLPPLKCYTFVTALGSGDELQDLAQGSLKPALDFGGNVRIIDFVLSNIRNSCIGGAAVACQFDAAMLIRHLRQAWPYLNGTDHPVDILPAGTHANGGTGYIGDADAILQNLEVIDAAKVDLVLVLSGEHIYRMDYGHLIKDHLASGAAVTVVSANLSDISKNLPQPDPVSLASSVIRFPGYGKSLAPLRPHGAHETKHLDIYAFNWKILRPFLLDGATDLDADVLPAMRRAGHGVHTHDFAHSCVRSKGDDLHWSNLSTLDDYWHAHMDLIATDFKLIAMRGDWPIGGMADAHVSPVRFLQDTQGQGSYIDDCLISSGCQIHSAMLQRSIIGTEVTVWPGSRLTETVVMPGASIGRNVHLSKAIVTRGAVVPDGLCVGENLRDDAQWFSITHCGVRLISPEMLVRRARLLAG
jgi:glucose-1-phosphate adenylyltransferase